MFAVQTVGCSVAGSSVFHKLQNAFPRFNVEGAIHHFVFKSRHLNFDANPKRVNLWSGNRQPLTCCEV
jgi:hypothetical protein